MRTFSKSYSLAGLRVGWCVGPEDLIAAMYKVKDSYNVDAVAQAVALAAIRDQKWMLANRDKVVKTRGRFTAALEKRGWDVIPSESNFVFAKPPAPETAKDLFVWLKAKNIFVRYFPGPKTGDRLRITIGTEGQMKALLSALDGKSGFRGR
jgi:histidinol-phosphate aminotransferase